MQFQILEGKRPVKKATMCGYELPEDITLHQMPVMLLFTSDEYVRDRGYIIEYSTIPSNSTSKYGVFV